MTKELDQPQPPPTARQEMADVEGSGGPPEPRQQYPVATAEPLANSAAMASNNEPDPSQSGAPIPQLLAAGTSLLSVSPGKSVLPAPVAPMHELDAAMPLNPRDFPSQPRNPSHAIPTTVANVLYLLTSYGITARYNVIKKKLIVTMPGHSGSADNYDNIALTTILSLASLNGLATGQVAGLIEAAGDRNLYNPVADWIYSKPWDGKDRLPDLYRTLVERDDYPKSLKERLLHRWLTSAVAAVLMPSGFRGRGVLTLQGPQSIGKTAWFNALVSEPALRKDLIKIDHHLDAGNKDSILVAIEHWIVEIGELDSSFKKDIARLKGFLTADQDKVRRPYGRLASEYPRRTVFCASVNERSFLVDPTGNTRFWTIPVERINYQHGIDMQQVFAQLAVEYQNGAVWWLNPEEELELEEQNKDHRAISALRERLLEELLLERSNDKDVRAMTPIQVLSAIGIERPTNGQCKECGSVLRELLGESKRINGYFKWRVPLRSQFQPTLPAKKSDDDLY